MIGPGLKKGLKNDLCSLDYWWSDCSRMHLLDYGLAKSARRRRMTKTA
jgi:hypothetical protein